MGKPGPKAGSEGARKIAEAHRGSHDHDQRGGFAANPGLAREAGRKGGETVKSRYGPTFYQAIGKKGGETVKRERGIEFYAEIGRKGGEVRGKTHAENRADRPASEETPPSRLGRPRGSKNKVKVA